MMRTLLAELTMTFYDKCIPSRGMGIVVQAISNSCCRAQDDNQAQERIISASVLKTREAGMICPSCDSAHPSRDGTWNIGNLW